VILPPDPNPEHRTQDPPILRDDTRFAAGKIAVFQYATVAVFLFLITGFWKLQVQNPQFYDQRAMANSIKSVPVLAPRGRLLDRDGRVIVDNHSSYSVILARESLKEEHLRPIAQGLDLDYEDLRSRVARYRRRPKYEPIVLKEEVSSADLAFVDSHHDFFPELVLISAQRRIYPQYGMMAHMLGYTGEVSDAELDSPEFARYSPGEVVGKVGIERQYNEWLMGTDGSRQVVVDNRGQVRQVLAAKPAIPGKDLQLTIDLDVQVAAELAMDGKNGAVVALDPRNGEVLAMLSRPTFDPNKFAVHIKAKDWKEITDNPDKPMLNRAIQAALAPGSTFKPFVALAGLETGTVDDKFSVHCSGGISLYGTYQHCWQKKGHGTVSMHRGIEQSCDVYFYTLGAKLGIEKIASYADLAGMGHITGVDLPHEQQGVVPSEKWKLRTQRQKWYAGETPSVAIGQGALTVTPIQLARAIAGVATGGTWYQPHLTAAGLKNEKPKEWALNAEHVRTVVDGMYSVVNEGGTGGRARLPGIEVCGKTGSAQVVSNELAKSSAATREMKDNGWFEAFAPRSAPEIVVVVLFEGGEHGGAAAAISRDVLKAYFDKKARVTELQRLKGAIADKTAILHWLGLPDLSRWARPAVSAPRSIEYAMLGGV
jgi:penicillin-binding protein 2